MSRPLALVIDDEPDLCELLALTLDRMQIDTQTCGDIACAKTRLRESAFDLCLTDMRLPDGDGLELVEWIQANGIETPVAVITAHGNVETAVRALKLGAFDFISKPLDLTALRKLIGSALKLQRPDKATTGKVRLLGDSPVIVALLALIEKVARSRAPVHITGESGTGKELVARMIHKKSAQSEGPFIPVNCGAIPSELMESEFCRPAAGHAGQAIACYPGKIRAPGRRCGGDSGRCSYPERHPQGFAYARLERTVP